MTDATSPPTLPGFDPFSAEYLADPTSTWSRAQRESPVFYYPPMNLWVLTRFDDVMRAVKDWRTFSSRALGIVPPPSHLAERIPADFFRDPIAGSDPPLHTTMRKACNTGFTRPRIGAMESSIRAIADDLIDRFDDRGSCDLMEDFCYPLSLRTIVHLLGLDESETDSYRRWTEDLFAMLTPRDPELGGGKQTRPISEAQRESHWAGLAAAIEHYRELIADRRARPRDDVISVLVQARDDSGAAVFSEGQVMTLIEELIAAGNDTTANLMGSIVLFLSERPDQLAEAKADPALIERAVEEGLRRRGSSVGMFRYTTTDVTVSGVEIPRGATIWVGFQATGHDEQYFPNPRSFDLHRENAGEHLAFGKGRHFCLGAPLARLEARVGLEALFDRLPGIAAKPGQSLEYAPVMTVSMLYHLEACWS